MNQKNELSQWLNKTLSSKTKADHNQPKTQDKPLERDQKSTVKSNLNQQPRKRPPKAAKKTNPNQPPKINQGGKQKMQVIPLGGLNEVGKNSTVIEYDGDIIVIDCGMQFPEEDMLGIDFVIPDFTYLEQNRHKIKALVITHGHLDHIGAIPHFLRKFGNVPVFATKLTIGLIQKHLEDFKVKGSLNVVNPDDDQYQLGNFTLGFFRVNHSIPDGMGIFIQSPAGNIVHTGDFKFDFNPADGVRADFGKLAEIGSKGIDVLFADSTNAQKPGFCVSESVVAKTLERVIRRTKGRLIIASFSSLIGRLQQIIDYATLYGRQIFVSGRSMIQNLEIASKLGYVKVPRGILKRMSNKVDDLPPEKVLILSTGSQGESMSALSRIALGNHPQIKIKKGDTVIFSSSPIPGNERATATVINNLFRLGAHVITNDAMDVHTSGHAHQGDLKLMYSLIRPKFVAPIHGEFFMRMAHVEMMQQEFGLDQNETIVLENGSILEIANKQARKSKKKAPANIIMVDGLGVGDVGTKVIRDRQVMAENGVVIALFRAFDKSKRLVADPDIISRGFIYMKESKNIADETKQKAKKAYEDAIKKKPNLGLKELKMEISRSLSTFIRKRLDREPMIMPVIVFV